MVDLTDNMSQSFTYSLDGMTYEALPADKTVTVPVATPGVNVITLRIKDESGNISIKSITIRKL